MLLFRGGGKELSEQWCQCEVECSLRETYTYARISPQCMRVPVCACLRASAFILPCVRMYERSSLLKYLMTQMPYLHDCITIMSV